MAEQFPSLIFGTVEKDDTRSGGLLQSVDRLGESSGEAANGSGTAELSTTPLLSTLLIGEEEQPVMGMLGFGVVTFGTATCIFCILANTVVLLDIRREFLSTSISHRTHQLFHVTQTVIDFLLGILIMPIHVLLDSHLAGDWLFNTPLCRVWYAFDVALCTAAIWNQYISCLDKYWCVTSPNAYVGKRRRSRIKQMFRILALLAFGIGSPVLFDCNLADNAIYAFYSTLASFWVPMVTLLALSIRSYRFRRGLIDVNKKASVFASPIVLAKSIFDAISTAQRNRVLKSLKNTNNSTDNNSINNDVERAPVRKEVEHSLMPIGSAVPPLPPRPPSLVTTSTSMPCFVKQKDNNNRNKKPVSMCARHYNARDNGPHISAIRHALTPPQLLSPELMPVNDGHFIQKTQTVVRLVNGDYDELKHRQGFSHFSLKSLMQPSSSVDDENQHRSCNGNLLSSSNNHVETTNFVELMNKSRRVRFNVDMAPTSPPVYGELHQNFCGNGVVCNGQIARSPSSLSRLNNKPVINGDINHQQQIPSDHIPNGNIPSGADGDDQSGEDEDDDVEKADRPRHHSSTSSLQYHPHADQFDDDIGNKMVFFRRLRAFVNNSLSKDSDEQLPFDDYWRQCNVNERFIYSTAIVLSVCWGPFFLMYAIGLFFKIESSHKAIRLLLWFGYFNSALNPALIPILTRLYE